MRYYKRKVIGMHGWIFEHRICERWLQGEQVQWYAPKLQGNKATNDWTERLINQDFIDAHIENN